MQKLVKITAGEKNYNSISSVHRLGQIAFTKLLSPSQRAMLTKQYLYNDFTTWMRDNGIDIKIKLFHSVVANRLGRAAEIAKKFN